VRDQALVVDSADLGDSHHRLLLRSPEIAARAAPGQFLHVWCHDSAELDRPPVAALLRRPYSISDVRPDGALEVLLRARGTGGRLLAAKRAGDCLDVIGPLGRGFSLARGLELGVIVAGGIGLAPVPFLIRRLREHSARVVLLAGATEDAKVPFTVHRPARGRATLVEPEALGAEVTFVSETVEGLLISEVLEARLGDFPAQASALFAVGPRAMLKRLVEVTRGCLPVQVSLEERMACGLGACRSCVVPAMPLPDEPAPVYRTVCRDGPVFSAEEVNWEALAT
jgi:dihydroorotate dehydrogenase electron transfer subunit